MSHALGALLLAGCATRPPAAAEAPAPAAEAREAEARQAGPRWSVIGTSVRGAAIEACRAGRGGTRLLIIGAIHGDESESLGAMDDLAALLAEAEVEARIIRDLNPDGTADRRRGNARGVDLNRNFPAANFRPSRQRGEHALSEPESSALVVELDAFDPEVVIVCHSTPRGPFVNFDGPADDLAGVFADAASAVDARWRVVSDMGYATPGSLGSFVGVDRGVPILTIEMRRGGDPAEAHAALLAGVAAVVDVIR